METDEISELDSAVIKDDDLKILPIAAIYGANESGKSNLISAFQFMKKKITDDSFNEVKPFVFTHELQDSYFSVTFLVNQNKVVNYSFALDENGTVVSESLDLRKENGEKSKQIFNRNKTGISLNESIKRYKKNLETFLNEKVLLLTFLKNLKEESIGEIYHWFEEIDVVTSSDGTELDLVKNNLKKLLDNPDLKNGLLNYLDSVGSSIKDIDYENSAKPNFFTTHFENNEKFILSLEDESVGIIKMIGLYSFITKSLKLGIPLFVDDLGSQLHPLLLRYIVVNFTNKNLNPNHAQLIFTSHDFSLLNMTLLRRDEIWFVEKNENISELYSFSDFRDRRNQRIRKNESFVNEYFLGGYGAVPDLKDFSLIEFI